MILLAVPLPPLSAPLQTPFSGSYIRVVRGVVAEYALCCCRGRGCGCCCCVGCMGCTGRAVGGVRRSVWPCSTATELSDRSARAATSSWSAPPLLAPPPPPPLLPPPVTPPPPAPPLPPPPRRSRSFIGLRSVQSEGAHRPQATGGKRASQKLHERWSGWVHVRTVPPVGRRRLRASVEAPRGSVGRCEHIDNYSNRVCPNPPTGSAPGQVLRLSFHSSSRNSHSVARAGMAGTEDTVYESLVKEAEALRRGPRRRGLTSMWFAGGTWRHICSSWSFIPTAVGKAHLSQDAQLTLTAQRPDAPNAPHSNAQNSQNPRHTHTPHDYVRKPLPAGAFPLHTQHASRRLLASFCAWATPTHLRSDAQHTLSAGRPCYNTQSFVRCPTPPTPPTPPTASAPSL